MRHDGRPADSLPTFQIIGLARRTHSRSDHRRSRPPRRRLDRDGVARFGPAG
ncbi:hypothetical protein BOS5A_210127 [Bosea sp. EC-HK365B]|nr:hypothetical protein BOSE21B_80020 [Bosea sp. 21B]CAD5300484.1 hypothetical protein BOSE7B_70010 [Bosea sp. 7B]VVT59336.1 hypothetical protein BOS5A_210127 [Bosea sp. EC-HK365B]VXB87122.1 hypothetical protein BOSE127_160021 [Bosea sp. 127]